MKILFIFCLTALTSASGLNANDSEGDQSVFVDQLFKMVYSDSPPTPAQEKYFFSGLSGLRALLEHKTKAQTETPICDFLRTRRKALFGYEEASRAAVFTPSYVWTTKKNGKQSDMPCVFVVINRDAAAATPPCTVILFYFTNKEELMLTGSPVFYNSGTTETLDDIAMKETSR